MPSLPSKIRIIVNPAAGQESPLLRPLNDHFKEVDWDIRVTHTLGDGRDQAKKAIEDGAELVVACGGDGTVLDVVSGLARSDVPLLILPFGTGNQIAEEFGLADSINGVLDQYLKGALTPQKVDVGQINNDQYFMLRCGCGVEADTARYADRDLKTRWGKLAYIFGFLKAFARTKRIEHKIWIDDHEPIIEKGLFLTIANAGRIGLGAVKLSPQITIDDGRLDVVFLRRANLRAALEILRLAQGELENSKETDSSRILRYSQAKRVRVETNPPCDAQADGDLIGQTPLDIQICPRALTALVAKK